MKYLRSSLASILMIVGVVGVAVPTVAAESIPSNAERALCEGSGGTMLGDGSCSTENKRTLMGTIQQVVNILLFVVGLSAVIMIVVGGLRYVLSGGDSAAINSAKNTVLYAIVGVVVALAAYAIVNFVVKSV